MPLVPVGAVTHTYTIDPHLLSKTDVIIPFIYSVSK